MSMQQTGKDRKRDWRALVAAAVACFVLFNIAATYIFGNLG